jgi:hypothetical protein
MSVLSHKNLMYFSDNKIINLEKKKKNTKKSGHPITNYNWELL